MDTSQSKFYKSQGFWWNVKDFLGDLNEERDIDGPYCLNCFSDLIFDQDAYYRDENDMMRFDEDWTGVLECIYCKRTFTTTQTIRSMKNKVMLQYVVSKRAELPKISLDDPPAQVKVRDQDDTYFLAAKIAEKDGKRVGVVYFGEKTKEQNKKDYSQIFLDLEDEQIRFDKSNKHPKDILAVLTVEFPSGTYKVNFKKRHSRVK